MSETPIKDSCQTVLNWYDNLTCEPSDNLWELIQQIDNRADKDLTPAKVLDLIYYYIWKRKCYLQENPEIIICQPPLEAVFQREMLISPQIPYLVHKNLLFRKEDLEILQQLDPLTKAKVTGKKEYKKPPKQQVYIEPDNDSMINDRFKPDQELMNFITCSPEYLHSKPPTFLKFIEIYTVVKNSIEREKDQFQDESNPHLLHMRRHPLRLALKCDHFYMRQLAVLVRKQVSQVKLTREIPKK